ncbi:hypothetical protein HDV01_003451 [Terramyces sp. JEL0728]|nr:hypothetical protein HDV01_003451 [Terramyces sp. JEL0728]
MSTVGLVEKLEIQTDFSKTSQSSLKSAESASKCTDCELIRNKKSYEMEWNLEQLLFQGEPSVYGNGHYGIDLLCALFGFYIFVSCYVWIHELANLSSKSLIADVLFLAITVADRTTVFIFMLYEMFRIQKLKKTFKNFRKAFKYFCLVFLFGANVHFLVLFPYQDEAKLLRRMVLEFITFVFFMAKLAVAAMFIWNLEENIMNALLDSIAKFDIATILMYGQFVVVVIVLFCRLFDLVIYWKTDRETFFGELREHMKKHKEIEMFAEDEKEEDTIV